MKKQTVKPYQMITFKATPADQRLARRLMRRFGLSFAGVLRLALNALAQSNLTTNYREEAHGTDEEAPPAA
jgi:hypothetical protein